MAYTLYNADGTTLLILPDGIVDQSSTSLSLVGKNTSNFGAEQNQNFVLLLENFSNVFQPANPKGGQLWFDKKAGVMRTAFYDGTNWRPTAVMLYSNTTTDTSINLGGANFAASTPGDFWFNTAANQLYVIGTGSNTLIGPEQVSGFNTTKMSSTAVADVYGTLHPVIEMVLDGQTIGIISSSTFQSTSTISATYPFVNRGITLTNNSAMINSPTLVGTTITGTSIIGSTITANDLTANNFTSPIVQSPIITNVGTTSSTLTLTGSDQLNLTSAGTVVISATGLIAPDLTTPLGTSSNRWTSVYTTNLNAGSHITTGTLTGSWTVPIGSSLVSGSDGNIDLGSNAARWDTVWAKTINAGSSAGTLAGNWTIGSSLYPAIDLTANLGSINYRWANVFTTDINAGSNPLVLSASEVNPESDLEMSLGSQYTRWTGVYTNNINSGNLPLTLTSGVGSPLVVSGQSLKPNLDISIPLGTASNRWTTVYATELNAGDASSDGTLVGQWSLGVNSTLQSTYADLAEFYEGDQEYEPGTVLVFGGDKEVTTTNLVNDTRTAGVVTTDPAYIMNKDQQGVKVCIALVGRVPVKVIGTVKKGDILTTSETVGYATKAVTPTLCAIIGKALEDKNYDSAGVIQVAIGRA